MNKDEVFRKMLEKFKKTSRDKNREAEKCHSKSETRKKKSANAKKRKVASGNKNR